MASLHKKLTNFQELDEVELAQVSGGTGEETKTCYVDAGGKQHCVRNWDDGY